MANTVVNATDLGSVVNAIHQVNNTANQIQFEVSEVKSQQAVVRSDIQDLRRTVEAFIAKDELAKRVQLSQTQLIEVRQELESEFGHHKEIRRTATGILQALDTGIVSQDAIRDLSERQMLTVAGYWLAPAIVALAAWIRDEQELAKKAVGEAVRRDHEKTSLFFALVLRRFGREEAVAEWILQYMNRQDPLRLSREFVVIMDATSSGGFGASVQHEVSQQIEQWLAQASATPAIVSHMKDRWKDGLTNLNTANYDNFGLLYSHTAQAQQLKENYDSTGVNDAVNDWLDEIFQKQVQIATSRQHQVDAILTDLVAKYDAEELPLRSEEARLRAIVKYEGDLTRASSEFLTQEDSLKDRIDLPTLLCNSALNPEISGSTASTQRLSIALSKEYLTTGYDLAVLQYREHMVHDVHIDIDGWQQAIPFNFQETDLQQSLALYSDQQTQQEVDAVKVGAKHYFGIVLCVMAFIIGLLTIPFGIAFCLGAALGGFFIWKNIRGIDARKAAAQAAGDLRKADRMNTLAGILAELVNYRRAWDANDKKQELVSQKITEINVSANMNSGPSTSRGALLS